VTRIPDLDKLPANAVRPLGPLDPAQLRAAAAAAGHEYREIRFNGGADKKAVLRTIAQALSFPAWFGANLDALYDCLTDLPDSSAPGAARGWVIVLGALPDAPHLDAETRSALLDVFRDAAEDFATRGVALRVFTA
jgi:RNAse (barnase) inhibitor barstar